MRPLAVLLVIVQLLLRGVAAGHSTAADAHAPAVQPHLHLGAHAHDHRLHDHGHDHRQDGEPAVPGSRAPGACSNGKPSHGHDCEAIFLVDDGVSVPLGTRAAPSAAAEPMEWIDAVTDPADTTMLRGRRSPCRVRPPGSPASPFPTLLPHRLRV